MKKLTYPLLMSLAIILIGCTGKNTIKVTNRNFTDEISQFQNLIFEFNNEMVSDSLLNIWDSTEYISFSPAVRGKFRWEAHNQLIFSPSEGFAPSTDYTARLTNNLQKHLIKKKRISSDEFKFHTTYLKLSGLNAYWALSDDKSGQIIIHTSLEFNYPVDPAQLKNLLMLYIHKEKVDFRLITDNINNNIEIAINPPKVDPTESIPIKVLIAKGLKCAASKWFTTETIEQVFELPPQSQLQIMEMIPGYDEGMATISILTTQPVVNENLKDLIKITPAREYTAALLPNGIILKGGFLEGETYEVTISGKLKGIFGKDLGKDYTQSVVFAKQEPMLSFTDKSSIYLSSKGERNIGINIINVPRVKLTVFKIFENNIIHYIREGKRYNYYYDEEDEWYDSYEYRADENYGKVIFTKEVDTRTLQRKGNINLLNINLNQIGYSNELKGIYLIRVESTDKRWLQDAQLVSVSDLGLIAKQGINSIFIMANSIINATPVPDVTLTLISSNNQKVSTIKTDNNGIASIDDLKKSIGDFNVAMITARSGDDFNFLIFNNSQVDQSRFNVGGKRTKEIDYDVFVYGPRDIYRPGDSVYFNTVVRTFRWKPVDKIPLKIKILLPNGKDFQNFKKIQNSQGASEIKFLLPSDIMTGMYSVQVFSGNDILLKTTRFSVEEFMPDRISVTINLNKKEYRPSEELKAEISAKNLFGPPAANRNVEAELSLTRAYFQPENIKGYNFNITEDNHIKFENIVQQGKTNDEGNVTQTFTLPAYKNIGLVSGKIYTTVFDETGRPVNRLTTFDLYTQEVFFGIKYFDSWVDTKKPLKLNFIAASKSGKILNNIPAKIVIKKFMWENVMERSGNSYRYNSQLREQVVLSKNITISGNSTYIDYTPMQSGEYELRIMRSDEEGYVSQRFYAFGWGDTDYSSFQVNKEGEVTIECDKKSYKTGDKANILFKSPFPGKIIVTIERDKIFEHYVLTTDNKAASLSLSIKEDFLPNVYISATAIREMGGTDMPLTVAHGYLSINIENPSNKLNLKIDAVAKSKSKTKQNITIKTEPNTELTVSIVDEGILQVTNFKTPDIFEYFYTKRANEVNAYDLYPLIFPELKFSSQRSGGDGGYDLNRRTNPLTSKRVKLISLWSGILKSNNNGICNFSVNIPQFSGALRVMAVAYKDQKFSSSDHLMKIADAVVISTALPRFLSPGDIVSVPVTLTNTTNSTVNSNITISVNGPLEILDANKTSVKLKSNSENQVMFKIKAKSIIGQAKITINVNGLNQLFTDETDMIIRPAAGLQKISNAGIIKASQTSQFNVSSDIMPYGIKSKLLISKSPIVEFCKDISWLLEYPYGCSEQTISKAFPLIYYRDLAKAITQEKKATYYNPDFLVQQAIYKVESRQTYNGGIAYWDGAGEADWWISVYAAHFLYEAKQAGFEVNIPRFENIIKYIQQNSKQKVMEEYFYYDGTNTLKSYQYAKREILYSIYLLALTGKQNLSLMNYYKANKELLTWDSRYMLACAYALIGDKFSYTQLLPQSSEVKKSSTSFGGSYYSYARDLAIALYTLLDSDPNNKQVGILARHLSESMKVEKSMYYSTQSRAFALLALGKFAKKAASSKINATIFINGKVAGYFTDKDVIFNEDINNKTIKITTTGSGNLFYFYELQGLSATGKYTEEDRYLKVRRNYYDRFGHLLTGNTFSVNDLIVIEISAIALENRNIENVAITDILPACFEIENPRITPERDYTWMKANKSDYTDIRDDRITFFTTLSAYPSKFYYSVRAVSSGTYQAGPVSADAMYNGEYHSYNGGGTIVVK